MPSEGTDVLDSLKAALREAKTALSQCEAEASALDARAKELVARRGEALLELARHFLPEISRPAIQANFAGIRADLTAILARKEARQKDLSDKLALNDEAAKSHDAEIDDVTARLNARVAERETLEAKVAEALKANDDFQQRSKLALEAEQQLHRDEQRAEEIRKEAAEKLPPYEKSRLFLYLYERGYATTEYKPTGLIKALDRWVARLIGYEEARAGYEFLRKTPGLVDAEVARRRDVFHELMEPVEAVQREEADKAGLTAVLKEGDALGTKRDALVAQRDQLRKRSQVLRQGLAELDRAQNAFYTEALERFRGFLGETRLALLEKRAKQTPEPEDDAIVAQLAELNDRIDEVKPRMAELTERRHAADRLREGLDRVASRFRQANFDSSRSYFDGRFNPAGALADFESGAIEADEFWNRLSASQRFRPHWVERTADGAAGVVTGPAGRVILGAVLDVASAAAQASAARGVQRRAEEYAPTPAPSYDPPPAPAPSYDPPPAVSVPSSVGSFTSGEGF